MSKIRCSVTQIQENRQPKVTSTVTHLKPIALENDTMATLAIKFVETDARKIRNLIGKDLNLTDIVEVTFKVTEEQFTLDSETFEEDAE